MNATGTGLVRRRQHAGGAAAASSVGAVSSKQVQPVDPGRISQIAVNAVNGDPD
jgi:hypothetical protein